MGVPGPSPQPPGWAPNTMMPARTPMSATAVTSLVLALLWVCGLGSIAAVVLGIIGLRATKGGAKRGRGLAIGGLVVGLLGTILAVVALLTVVLAADQTFITQDSEKDDVTITNCERAIGGIGVVDISITNDSSKTSDYWIIVSFRSSGSSIDSTGNKIDRVAPGETVTATLTTTEVLTGSSDPTCSLSLVQRTASR